MSFDKAMEAADNIDRMLADHERRLTNLERIAATGTKASEEEEAKSIMERQDLKIAETEIANARLRAAYEEICDENGRLRVKLGIDPFDAPNSIAASTGPDPIAEAEQTGDGVYAVWYEDAEVKPEFFSGRGSREAATKRFAASRDNWNCYLMSEKDGPCVENRISEAVAAERERAIKALDIVWPDDNFLKQQAARAIREGAKP